MKTKTTKPKTSKRKGGVSEDAHVSSLDDPDEVLAAFGLYLTEQGRLAKVCPLRQQQASPAWLDAKGCLGRGQGVRGSGANPRWVATTTRRDNFPGTTVVSGASTNTRKETAKGVLRGMVLGIQKDGNGRKIAELNAAA